MVIILNCIFMLKNTFFTRRPAFTIILRFHHFHGVCNACATLLKKYPVISEPTSCVERNFFGYLFPTIRTRNQLKTSKKIIRTYKSTLEVVNDDDFFFN